MKLEKYFKYSIRYDLENIPKDTVVIIHGLDHREYFRMFPAVHFTQEDVLCTMKNSHELMDIKVISEFKEIGWRLPDDKDYPLGRLQQIIDEREGI